MIRFFLLFLFMFVFSPAYALEDFIVNELDTENQKPPVINKNYNYEDVVRVPVYISPKEKISTKDKYLYEGEKLKFVVLETVKYNGETILNKNDIIKGTVKYIIKSGMNGIPYSIYLDDFEIPNISPNKIMGEYHKDGQNRGYFVLPLKWALTILPPTGSLTNVIKGGHCTISDREKIVIYYYPNWSE